MVTNQQLINVYDFENIIPTAVSGVISVVGVCLQAFTYASKDDFQKIRPRVEVLFHLGSEIVPRRIIPFNGKMMNAAYHGTLICTTITDAADAQKATHATYLSQLRWLIPQMGDLCNQVVLPNHKLQFQRETGTSYDFSPEKGFFTSTLTFDVDVSIQADALSNLMAA